MARKTSARKTVPPSDPADRLLDAALALAAEQPWRRIAMGDIAKRAKLSLRDVHAHYRSKGALIDALMARVEGQVLAAGPGEGETVRERLFDLLMRRFEYLAPHRPALRSMARGTIGDPLGLLCRGRRFLTSMAWMLEAAGVSASGPLGGIKTRGLALIMARCLPVFLADESSDLAKTMACLDRILMKVSSVADKWLADAPVHQKK